MAATQPDEVLVQRPYPSTGCVQWHWGRAEFLPHRIVTAVALFLDTAKAELVAGVHAGNPADRQQNHQRVDQMLYEKQRWEICKDLAADPFT